MAKLMESIGTLVTSAFLKVAPLLSFCKDLLPAWTTGKIFPRRNKIPTE